MGSAREGRRERKAVMESREEAGRGDESSGGEDLNRGVLVQGWHGERSPATLLWVISVAGDSGLVSASPEHSDSQDIRRFFILRVI